MTEQAEAKAPKTVAEAIVELLAEEGELSTHQITERLNARGTRVNGTGQALGRLRVLERRGQVQRIPNPKRADWKLWKLA